MVLAPEPGLRRRRARRPAPPALPAARRAAGRSTRRWPPSSPPACRGGRRGPRRRSRCCAAATRAWTSGSRTTSSTARSPSATSCSPAGELAALVVMEAVARLVPGVLGNESLGRRRELRRRACSSTRSTRDLRSSAAGRCPRCCGAGTTGASRGGGGRRRCGGPSQRRPDLIAARGGLSEDEVQLLAEHGYRGGAHGTGRTDERDASPVVGHNPPAPTDRLEERDLS